MRCVCQQSLSIIRVSIIPSCRLCSVKFQPVSALVQTETSVKRSCQVKYQLRDTVHQQVGRETCCRTAPCIATCNKRENTTAGSSATTVQLSNPQSKRKEDTNHIEDTIVLYYIDSFFFIFLHFKQGTNATQTRTGSSQSSRVVPLFRSQSERSLLADKLGVWFRLLALRYELHGCLWLLRITQVNIVIY